MINFGEKYTSEELNARLKFFIGLILGLTLFGIVFVVLYSLIFVTQPMNGMSPVDNKFFELIIPIATFLTGTLSGIMLAGDDKESRAKALEAANRQPAIASTVSTPRPMSQTLTAPIGSGYVTTTNIPPVSPVTPVFNAQVVTGFGGKPAPMQPPQPEI
jgi:Na+-transporting methylmalonyl-CoA/oxaloacetate decarboxylase gamma subunit